MNKPGKDIEGSDLELPKELTDKALEKHVKDIKDSQKPKLPKVELSLTDIILGTVRDALEFNAQVIEVATQILAMDDSGHNKSTYRRVSEDFTRMNKAYVARLDQANQKIVAKFIRKPEEAAGKNSKKS